MIPPQVWHWLLLAVAALTVAGITYRVERQQAIPWWHFLPVLVVQIALFVILKQLAELDWWTASVFGALGVARIAGSITAERTKPRP